ncbi:MAG: SPOR domain-containing protein [Betaproteobacteria bacterium]
MASTKSTEPSATEIELKRRGRRRLIGAATIGLLAVVFLPMIFDGESKRNTAGSTQKKQEISVQVPPKDGQLPLPTPVVAASAAAPAPVIPPPVVAAEVTKPAVAEVKSPAPESAATKPAVAIVTAKTESPDPAAGKPAVAVADAPKKGFAVQLGVFADADNAKHTIEKMREAKLPVYSETIPIKSGNATRIRIGPFATQGKADSALVQIKLAGGDGKIIPLH